VTDEVVVDASALIAWLLNDDPDTALRFETVLRRSALIAPALLRAEVANALTTALRRERLTAARARQAARLADTLAIDYESPTESIDALFADACTHALTAYDAQYLRIAMRRGAQLLTADRTLQAAARAAGVALVTG
jgi:predicted nucleic acid-binding protein